MILPVEGLLLLKEGQMEDEQCFRLAACWRNTYKNPPLKWYMVNFAILRCAAISLPSEKCAVLILQDMLPNLNASLFPGSRAENAKAEAEKQAAAFFCVFFFPQPRHNLLLNTEQTEIW